MMTMVQLSIKEEEEKILSIMREIINDMMYVPSIVE
jgi:hypothetical protein